MAKSYNYKKVEEKWQKSWEKNKIFVAADNFSKEKYYCLIEFPYPSGEGLHVGHPRSYTAMDILARKRRMQGYNVLYPIGFDAFGLPSENYAIKTGIHPAVTTDKNIQKFTQQLKSLGFSFDWDRQVVTTDPKYYKWTQWIFLKMYEAGLAYKDKIYINWCPKDKIGLANEEVIAGKCERCGTPVQRRLKEQWMLKITNYADRLIDDLETVDYLEQIKTQQINWIGRSEGATIKFQIPNSKFQIEVFTTRPDTLYGATFMVLAPEHEIIANLKSQIKNYKEVEAYIEAASRKSDLDRTELAKEKTGVELKGVYAVNPANQQNIPIWVADYVLTSYGTGAIMAVPAHDQRDWEFAKKYKLPIVEVIAGGDVSKQAYIDIEEGKMINSGKFDGLPVKKCIKEITAWLKKENLGKAAVNYKLRDWVFSRQRYWGEPIPMIYCKNCGWVPVPQDQLPVELPKIEKYQPTDSGESPLAEVTDWVNTTCPKCGGPATRETDTMPNWAGSNWYFLRYLDPHNDNELADKKKIEYWMPVDWYNGGMEHTTLHLLYSRFVYKFLFDIGVIPKKCGSEPYKKRTSQGMILGKGNEKMSKSKGNVVNPDDIIKDFGADTFRIYEMFMGPFNQAIPWDQKGVNGARRFLEKIYDVFSQNISAEQTEDKGLEVLLNQTVKKVTTDIDTQGYNTAVSAMMIFVNKVIDVGKITKPTAETFLKILSPFAPHLAEELWEQLGHESSIAKESWPVFDEDLIKTQEVELVIQVNGKVRGKMLVNFDTTEQLAEKYARADQKIAGYLAGKTIKNVIFVPGRLINFVVE